MKSKRNIVKGVDRNIHVKLQSNKRKTVQFSEFLSEFKWKLSTRWRFWLSNWNSTETINYRNIIFIFLQFFSSTSFRHSIAHYKVTRQTKKYWNEINKRKHHSHSDSQSETCDIFHSYSFAFFHVSLDRHNNYGKKLFFWNRTHT